LKPGVAYAFVFVSLLNIACCSLLIAQSQPVVRTVQFVGNRHFSVLQYANVMQIKQNTRYQETMMAKDIQAIEEMYRSDGYLQARTDSVHIERDSIANDVSLMFYISEGKPSIVRSVEFSGNRIFTNTALRQWMDVREGSIFTSSVLEKDIQSILQQYEKAGYPLASVRVANILRRDTDDEVSMRIQLTINEGRTITISGLRVEGNTSTKTDVITREARLYPHELYNGNLPELIKRRLMRLQLFNSVSTPELYFDERDSAGLSVKVAEGNYNSFDGVLGYVPSSNTNSKGYVTGLVNVLFRNLFGTGRKLGVRWYQENSNTQEVEFNYLEPWVASLPLNAQFGFFQRKQDSTYIKMQYDLTAEWMLMEEFSVSGSFSQTNITPTEGYGRLALAASTTTSGGVAIQYDSRDNIAAPTQGLYYTTQYQSGRKSIKHMAAGGDSIVTATQRVLLDLKYYRTLWYRNVLAAELHVRDFRAGDIDQSDLFQLGGATTLRGYREGQFLGSRLVWSNLEYRILMASQSFVFGFVDAGYIVQPAITSIALAASEQTKIGYGVGVQLDSGIGLIGVSIALGEGDTFSTAKLHIRLINAF
jgi:outer membrane protein insertion porin family